MDPDNTQSDLDAPIILEVPSNQAANEDKSGVQKRIDELTAKIHASDKAMQDLMAQNQQLTQAAMQAMNRPVTVQMPQAPVQEEQLSEDATPAQIASFFARQNQKQMLAMRAEINTAVQGIAARQYQNEAQSVLASQDPVVKAEAESIMRYWRDSGKQGWEPVDAVRYAKGVLMEQGKWNPNNTQRRNGSNTTLTMPSGVAEPTTNEVIDASRIKDPADLTSWSLEKQLEYQQVKLQKTGQNSF